MNLDTALVAEAREVLGTNGTTDTVHKALEAIVLRARRRRAAEIDVSALDLEALRAPRTW